ncbi:mucin-4-like isoform X2 [Crotalus tigris]|uniref:mucin-4-like isoform X2 n=1 Tax=Crotalus tigris TaxID=88082 RepID=UPI00192FA06A|nr:mucin-4-like isoform X2 [Crotalus tigris]
MGSPKEVLQGPLFGFWAWLLCGIATGAALPVTTEQPVIQDDYSTPNFPATVAFTDYFEPTLPTTTEEDFDFPDETTFPSETNGETPDAVGEGETSSPGELPKSRLASGEGGSGPLITTPKTFKIPEDLKETSEVPSVDKRVLSQVNSSEPTLEKVTLEGDPLAESQEASKETPAPVLDEGHQATELITERYSGVTDAPVTVLATQVEDLLASPSGEEAQIEISSERPPEGENPWENLPGEPNLDDELKPISTSWEETEAAPLEAKEDTPEPSTNENGTLEDPSSNSTIFPSTPEDLSETREDAGSLLSPSSEDSPETPQSIFSTVFPSIWPSLTHAIFGSPETSDFAVDSLQPSSASVEGRGDAAPIPSSSGPELNHESPVNVSSEEPEDLIDAEASNSSPSDRTTDAPSDSGLPRDTLFRTSQLDAADIPLMGLSVTPGISSQLPKDGEIGTTSTVKGEGEEDSGNPKSNEGTPFVSPLPGQESAQGPAIPDGERSEDLLNGTASSLNPGVETANSELEDNEATAISNSVPEDEINPISSDSENESETLFDRMVTSPPRVDNDGADKAQEPPAEIQGPPTEASVPASANKLSSETEGNEVSPSGSPGNISSSSSENNETIPSVASGEVDTQANNEDHRGSDLLPPDTGLSSISGTPLPVGRSGTLDDQLSPSQSLVENALTSGSSSSSEGEPTYPSTSPDEALSGSLISEPDTTELPPNLLPGSQPSSQLPKGNEIETDSGDVEDSPPPPPAVDDEGAAEAQGPPVEASSSGSTNEPSSDTEGSEVSPSGSAGNISSSSSENSETTPSLASDEVDTQANNESQSGSNLSPSDTELSSISGTPLPNFSQLPKEDDMETHSGDPEDPVPINREKTSSAPSTLNPQSALEEATEEPNFSEPILSPEEKRTGSTSEQGVNEEPLLDSDNTQDTANTPPYEQYLDSEDALETSALSSGGEPAVKSGTISPLVDTETSTKTQEPSGETPSSASSEGILSKLEHEDGESSPGISSKTLDSSPIWEAVDESRDGEDGAGSASSAKTAITVSDDGQPGSDFPVGQLVTSPIGGILALAPLEDGETVVTNEEPPPALPNANVETFVSASVLRKDAPLETEAVSSVMPQSDSSTEGTENSASEPPAVGSQPSPDAEAAPELSKETEQLQTSAASEKELPLASSSTESQEHTTSENGGFSGALTKGSPALQGEVAGTANSPPAMDKASQFLPESVAPSDGAEDSEDITNTSKTSTSEEDTGGRSGGEFSLNNNGTETTTVEPAKNAGSQLPPEISEDPSGVNGKEGSLIPSAAGSHSTSTSTEEVEIASSESGTHPDSQPSLDGASTTEVQDSESVEAADDTSNNGEKVSLTSSATTSQFPGISVSEDIFGETGHGGSSLPAEELETTSSGSTNNSETPSPVAGGTTELSGMSNSVDQLESSPSANEEDTSLGSPPTESSTALEGQEVSGKPSNGDGTETANSKPATNAEPQSSPNDVGSGGGSATSEEAGTSQVSGVTEKEGTLTASAVESPAISSSSEEAETNNTATNADSQLPPDGDSAAGTPSPDSAEISKASSSGEKGSLSQSTAESLGDSLSVEEVGTASRKSTIDVGSQLSADGTSPEGSLASEGAEPTESHSIASVDNASLVPPSTELQFPETSANDNILGGLESGEPSLVPGEEIANSGSSNNAGSESESSQTSPDSVATEGAEPSEDNSVVSEKQLSLAPSSTEPQSAGASVSEKVSENLVNGEPPLSTDGEKDAANVGTADAQGPTSSTGTGPNQNNIAEQPGQNLDAVGGQFSADGATISKPSDETLISTSVSVDGNLATQGTSQSFGAPDSSQPSSDIQANIGSAVSLAGHISNGDTFGASDDPTAKEKADGEVLPEVSGWTSEGSDTVSESVHPSSAEGTKPAAGQPSGVASPLASLPPKKSLVLITSGLGALKVGKVVEKGSSPSTPEGTGKVVQSILPILQEISTALSAGEVQPSLLDTKGGPAKISKLILGKPGLQGKVDAPLLSSKLEVPAKTSELASEKPEPQDKAGVPLFFSKPEIPAKTSKLASEKPGLQGKVDAPLLSSKLEVPAKTSKLASEKPGPQDKADVSLLSSKPEIPAKTSKLASGKPGLQGKVDAPLLSSKLEVPAKTSKLVSEKPGPQGKADVSLLSSKPEIPAKTSKLASGKPGLQGKVDASFLSFKTEAPVETSQLPSGKSGLQLKGDAPVLSFKTGAPVETSQLPSGKSGLQLKGDAPVLSFKTGAPVETSQLPSGKSGLQLKGDAPVLSFKTEAPVETSQLPSGKSALQLKGDAPVLSFKTEAPVETSQLPSGKSGLQLKGDAPVLSFKTEAPVETSQLPSGKSALQLKGDAPVLSFKTEAPVEISQLPSGKSGLQLRGDAPLLSFNSGVLANSEHSLPGQQNSASSESSSASEEKDGDSTSVPSSSEEHQTLIKGKVALDLSKTQPDEREPGVRLALSGVGLLKSTESTSKSARKKSNLKKSKTRPDKNSAIITGAPSVSLYPYGDGVNDKRYVERKVDFNSPLFKPEIGIPLGNTLHDSLYFTDNGQIIFPASDRDISSYPNPPPGGFNGREKVPMVAVFWDNADFSKGSGVIFYQEYPCGNSARHPLVQDVEAKIRRYIRSSYKARWLLKVTWDKVQPYPGQKKSDKTNTYQAILTTDGYRTYALFLYQDGGMQWDYAKLPARNVLIGYTSGDGYFKNDHLMMATPAEKYRPDRFQGYNTDVRGLWVYKLDSRIRVNYRQKCLDWLSHERFPSAWNRNLPPCPCSLQQGMSDSRYTTSQKGGQNLVLLYSSRPNSYRAGVRCLYDKKDQLQEGRQERIWKYSRKNSPNNDEELKLHDWCCNQAGNPLLCDKYDQKRPRIGCQGYKPPIQG